jgi:methionine-rich copper-binding protein CopC
MKSGSWAFFVSLALASASPALAQHEGHPGHRAEPQSGTMLAASAPADGAVLADAPRTLMLSFSHPVILQTVAITGPDGAVRASFRRPVSAADSYSVALPQLTSGIYEARWTASGGGHQMQGVVAFTVQ